MTRPAIIAALVLTAFASNVCAADLPTGTWAVNTSGKKGELVITEVKGTTVKAKLFGNEVTGFWNGERLTLNYFGELKGFLLSEPEKGKTKYTLAGVSKEVKIPFPQKRFGEVAQVTITGGWYAQLTADTPVVTGEIKAEVRGVLVLGENSVYVSVKRKPDVENATEETRISVSVPDAEWKKLKDRLQPLNGKEVIVGAPIAQMKAAGVGNPIPDGALIFLGKFEPKLANPK